MASAPLLLQVGLVHILPFGDRSKLELTLLELELEPEDRRLRHALEASNTRTVENIIKICFWSLILQH